MRRLYRLDIRLRQSLGLRSLGILIEGDGHVRSIEIFLCYTYDLFFGEILDTLVLGEDILSRFVVYERVQEALNL